MVIVTFVQFFLIILYHTLTYALHYDLMYMLKATANKISLLNKSHLTHPNVHNTTSLNIPDRVNYTEYREDLLVMTSDT